MKEKKFLPLGSVVLLEGGIHELMIIGYTPNTVKKNGKVQTYDYSGCIFPEGLLTAEQIVAFNESDISKVNFEGYSSKESVEFRQKMNNYLKEIATIDDEGHINIDPNKMMNSVSKMGKKKNGK